MGGSAREAVRQGRGALEGVIEQYRRALGVGTSEIRATRTDRGSRGPRADDIVTGTPGDDIDTAPVDEDEPKRGEDR